MGTGYTPNNEQCQNNNEFTRQGWIRVVDRLDFHDLYKICLVGNSINHYSFPLCQITNGMYKEMNIIFDFVTLSSHRSLPIFMPTICLLQVW